MYVLDAYICGRNAAKRTSDANRSIELHDKTKISSNSKSQCQIRIEVWG